MTAAFIVAVVVAVAALVSLGLLRGRSTAAVGRAEERAEQLTTRLSDAVELLEEIETQKRAAEVRATAAEGRARSAEQKATDAERRAGDAEKRVADALRRAEEAARASDPSRSAGSLWELERLRMQREWSDVAGPGVDLPLAWDGGIDAVVATELALIRETMGTPSELELSGSGPRWEASSAPAAARVGVELLRRLARSGEEMTVVLGRNAMTVTQPLSPEEDPPDLSALVALVPAAGLALEVRPGEGAWTIELSVAGRA